MANDNETVEQVALSDRPLAEQIRIIRGNYSIGSGEFDALDEAADVVECHQREIAAKDAEIEKTAEIARLRALVGELADALNASCDCHLRCDGCKMADESKFYCPEKACRALVERAREVAK